MSPEARGWVVVGGGGIYGRHRAAHREACAPVMGRCRTHFPRRSVINRNQRWQNKSYSNDFVCHARTWKYGARRPHVCARAPVCTICSADVIASSAVWIICAGLSVCRRAWPSLCLTASGSLKANNKCKLQSQAQIGAGEDNCSIMALCVSARARACLV